MNFKVMPIPSGLVSETCKTLVSPQYPAIPAHISVATGYGPCRSCLRVFEEGKDERISLTYNAFDGRSELPDPGPIFIHKDECPNFDEVSFPSDLRDLPLLLEAFGDESVLISRERMMPGCVESQIEKIFEKREVSFVNLRNAEAGCFVASVDRLRGRV